VFSTHSASPAMQKSVSQDFTPGIVLTLNFQSRINFVKSLTLPHNMLCKNLICLKFRHKLVFFSCS